METFVVRIFVPASDERLELVGVVEHPGTGRSEHFRGTESLVHVVLHQFELGRADHENALPEDVGGWGCTCRDQPTTRPNEQTAPGRQQAEAS
jgi:hypothetical protein